MKNSEGSANKDSSAQRRKKQIAWAGFLLGILALGIIMSWTGFQEVGQAFVTGGPALLLLVFLYPVELFPRAAAWGILYPSENSLKRGVFVYGTWIGQSLNRLIPTATIGGDIIRGRLLLQKGGDESGMISSLIADKTAHAVSILMLLILGIFLIITRVQDIRIIAGLLIAVLILGTGIVFFIRLQRSSGISSRLDKWSSDGKFEFLSTSVDAARNIENHLENLYSNPGKFLISVSIRIGFQIALAAEIWAAAWLMGFDISVFEAVTLRVVSFGVRSLAFVVWGGLGVQEGVYALLSAFVGLQPGTLIAISLATRVREIIAAAPGVIVWITGEGMRAVRPDREKTVTEDVFDQ